MRNGRARLGVVALLAIAAVTTRGDDAGPGRDKLASLTDGFETARPAWRLENQDNTVALLAHDRTDRAAHSGTKAERFRFRAGAGSEFYYSYRVPKIPLHNDLKATLYVRSTRPGVQILARVALPADTDPETGEPSIVQVLGTIGDAPDRWQRLEVADFWASVQRQARVLRFDTRRPVSLEGAYLDRIVVNLYCGPGDTEVFLDDLTVSPVPGSAVAEAAGGPTGDTPGAARRPGGPKGGPRVTYEGRLLRRDGRDWVPRIIHIPGGDPVELRSLGLDTLAIDPDADPEVARQAARAGLRLMPRLDPEADPSSHLAAMSQYPARDAVAFWSLGESLGHAADPTERDAELERIRQLFKGLHRLPPDAPRLTTGTVTDNLRLFAQPGQSLKLFGIRPQGWGTTQETREALFYFKQRRDLTALSELQGFFWAWVRITPDPVVREAIWGRDEPPAWGTPLVQPEQVRLFAYAALMAGFRGLGFWADAPFGPEISPAVREEVALLNDEVDLIEPLIARGEDPYTLLPTYPPDKEKPIVFNPIATNGSMTGVRKQAAREGETPPHPSITAVSLNTSDGGRLLMLADFAGAAQYQPPVMEQHKLRIYAQVPESSQSWEVGLGGVNYLKTERTPGGRLITLDEFDTTALVLSTNDRALVTRLEAEVRRRQPRATARAIALAEAQYAWVAEGHRRLELRGLGLRDADGKAETDAPALLAKARGYLDIARDALGREEYPLAWMSARRSRRYLRGLMRAHWDIALRELDKATKIALGRPDPLPSPDRTVADRIDKKQPLVITTPVASPAALAFNTLPQHHYWVAQIKAWAFGANLIPGGTFEQVKDLEAVGWSVDEGHRYERVETSVSLDKGKGWDKKTALKLKASVQERDLDRLAPFFDGLAVAVATPPVEVRAKQFLRIRLKVFKNRPQPPGAGGLIVRDSLGGEPLQYRNPGLINRWSELVLYRRVPADGEFRLTIGLAGLGEVWVDDVMVERIEAPSTAADPVARRPGPPAR